MQWHAKSPESRPFTCEERGDLGNHAEIQRNNETRTRFNCVLSSQHPQYHYPVQQTEAASKPSFLSRLLLSHLAGAPTLLWPGGWWRVHWLFLTNDAPSTHTHTLTHTHKNTLSWYRPTAAALFGPLWLPLSGPRPNTFHFPTCLSQLAQRVSDNDLPCSAHSRAPVSGTQLTIYVKHVPLVKQKNSIKLKKDKLCIYKTSFL